MIFTALILSCEISKNHATQAKARINLNENLKDKNKLCLGL